MEPAAASTRGAPEPPDARRSVGDRPPDDAARVAGAAAALAFSRFGVRPGGGPRPGEGGADEDGDGELRRHLSAMLSRRASFEEIKGDGPASAPQYGAVRRDSAVSAEDDDVTSLGSADLGASDHPGGGEAAAGGRQRSQWSLSASTLEGKRGAAASRSDAGKEEKSSTGGRAVRAAERDGRSAYGGGGHNSSVGSVTSLFRGSALVGRVLGRKRSDSAASEAASSSSAAPHLTQLPYRPARRGATVRRARGESSEEERAAPSLLMTRSWGGKTSLLTAHDGRTRRRRGAVGRRNASWNVHDDYRHGSDAGRVIVSPRRYNASGGGGRDARVSWNLVDHCGDADRARSGNGGRGRAQQHASRNERLSSLLSDISASIYDSSLQQGELVDLLYEELGGAPRKSTFVGKPVLDLPPIPPFGAGKKRPPIVGGNGGDGTVGPAGNKRHSPSSAGAENGEDDPFAIPPFRGEKLPSPLEADDCGSAENAAASDRRSSRTGEDEDGEGAAEDLVSYAFDHHRSGRPHGLSELTASTLTRASLLSVAASAEGSLDEDEGVELFSSAADDGEGNLAELHRRLSMSSSSPGGDTAAANLSEEDERQRRLLEMIVRMAGRGGSGGGNGSGAGDGPSEMTIVSRPMKGADDGGPPGGADPSGRIRSRLQVGGKRPADRDADPPPGGSDPGPPDGGIAVRGPPGAGAALSSPRPVGASAAGPNSAADQVEDYRTRLQRKRDLMESAYSRDEDCGINEERGSGNDDGGGPLMSRERLNEMLLENATSISNSLLLRRALLVLGQRSDGAHGAGPGGAAAGTSSAGGGTEGTETPEERRKARMRRANSHDTGLDRLAINHMLSLSSSRGNSGSGISEQSVLVSASSGGLAGSGRSVGWEFPLRAAQSSPDNDSGSSNSESAPAPPTPSAASANNPIRQLLGPAQRRRRATESDADPEQRSLSMPQVGAVQCNEPAPLLYTRAFSASSTGRGRERRAEARRRTIAALELDRGGGAPPVPEGSDEGSCSADGGVAAGEEGSTSSDGDCRGSPGEWSGSRHNDSYPRRLSSLESIREGRPGLGAASRSDAALTARGGGGTPRDERESSLHNSSWHALPPASSTATLRRRLSARIMESAQESPTGLARRRTSSSADSGVVTSRGRRSSRTLGGDGGGRAGVMSAAVSVRSARDLLEAVLVSDEIIHADHVETSFHGEGDEEEMLLPSTRERLAMMEDLFEELEEERDLMIDEFERRERVLKIVLGTAVLVIITLIVLVAVK